MIQIKRDNPLHCNITWTLLYECHKHITVLNCSKLNHNIKLYLAFNRDRDERNFESFWLPTFRFCFCVFTFQCNEILFSDRPIRLARSGLYYQFGKK